jgi:preprotein translocase subunit SecG
MTTRSFVIVVAVVALLLAGLVYMHRPRGTGARALAPHGQR